MKRKLAKTDVMTVPKCLTESCVWARVLRVIDGDTYEVLFLYGNKLPMRIRVRCRGIDTPEMRGKTPREKEAAWCATEVVRRTIENKFVRMTIEKWDKYGGRVVASVRVAAKSGEFDLGDHLVSEGYAKVYGGACKEEWKPAELTQMIRRAKIMYDIVRSSAPAAARS